MIKTRATNVCSVDLLVVMASAPSGFVFRNAIVLPASNNVSVCASVAYKLSSNRWPYIECSGTEKSKLRR